MAWQHHLTGPGEETARDFTKAKWWGLDCSSEKVLRTCIAQLSGLLQHNVNLTEESISAPEKMLFASCTPSDLNNLNAIDRGAFRVSAL